MTGTYTIQDFGPADLLTSDKEGLRRVKTSLPDQLFDGDKAMCGLSFACNLQKRYNLCIIIGVYHGASILCNGQQRAT